MKLADFTVQVINDKPQVSIPPGIKLIGADQMWPTANGKDLVVAIIDTGVDLNHPDLKANIIGGKSFVPGQKPDQYQDENGHGTHVAGTILANGVILGAAPFAKALILKVFGSNGASDDHTIALAFRYAADWVGPKGERVSVINASLGGPIPNAELQQAVRYCANKGILCCCAAGNEGDGNEKTFEYSYPAMYSEVLSVGAIDFNLKTTNFSNANNEVDIAAPGDNIVSTYMGGKYATLSGTSMATPHTAGLGLLYIGKFMRRFGRKPALPEIVTLLKALSRDVDIPGIDPDTGAGFIQQWI